MTRDLRQDMQALKRKKYYNKNTAAGLPADQEDAPRTYSGGAPCLFGAGRGKREHRGYCGDGGMKWQRSMM